MQYFALGEPLHFEAEGDVFSRRHIGKQSVTLKHHADTAFLRLDMRDVFAIDKDTAFVRRLETG